VINTYRLSTPSPLPSPPTVWGRRRKRTDAERKFLKELSVIAISPQEFEALVPLACAWAARQERLVLQQGVALTDDQIADAQRIGVAFPERVRLLQVEHIPLPDHPRLRQAAHETGLLSPDSAGLTLGYGILIRTPFWAHDLLIHELVHVWQYERFGGLTPFLRQYLWECITLGYAQSFLEREARETTAKICLP
jgi:hypothetical protein